MEDTEREFIPPNRLQLSLQMGMDGRLHRWSIHKLVLTGLFVLVIAMFISTIILILSFSGYSKAAGEASKLRAENLELRQRMEERIANLDAALDTLSLKLEEIKAGDASLPAGINYPYVSPGKTVIPYVQKIDNRLEDLQERVDGIVYALVGDTDDTPVMRPVSRVGAPSIYPTFGVITDGFGLRMHPILERIEFHHGIDIANNTGTAIYATAAGVVKKVAYENGYGKFIRIDHENGYETIYAHLYRQNVRVGDRVNKGQIIGLMGNTGLSTGPHVHYEVLAGGQRVNPAEYLNFIDETEYASN